MITKELFLNFIEDYRTYNKAVGDLYSLLHCSIGDTKIGISFYKILNIFLESNFNEDGIEWIKWYLYERLDDPSLKVYQDDKEIKLDTDEDFWNFIKDYTL